MAGPRKDTSHVKTRRELINRLRTNLKLQFIPTPDHEVDRQFVDAFEQLQDRQNLIAEALAVLLDELRPPRG